MYLVPDQNKYKNHKFVNCNAIMWLEIVRVLFSFPSTNNLTISHKIMWLVNGVFGLYLLLWKKLDFSTVCVLRFFYVFMTTLYLFTGKPQIICNFYKFNNTFNKILNFWFAWRLYITVFKAPLCIILDQTNVSILFSKYKRDFVVQKCKKN